MKTYAELKSDVIDSGLCVACGSCATVCPVSAIALLDSPTLETYCTGCGLCYESCPRTGPGEAAEEKNVFGRSRGAGEEETGINISLLAVRATPEKIRERCQDGGAVSALLSQLLADGGDAVVVAGVDPVKPWKPVPVVVEDGDAVAACAGTKYTSAPMVLGFSQAVKGGKTRLGFVGTPCQIRALRRIESGRISKINIVAASALKVGLFCMETFDYDQLRGYLAGQGVDLSSVRKFEIRHGKFIVRRLGGLDFEVKISRMKPFARGCCQTCTDYTADLADISVGNIGSPEGWSTVIVRTATGEATVKNAEKAGTIEVRPLDTGPGLMLLKKLAAEKRSRGKQ